MTASNLTASVSLIPLTVGSMVWRRRVRPPARLFARIEPVRDGEEPTRPEQTIVWTPLAIVRTEKPQPGGVDTYEARALLDSFFRSDICCLYIAYRGTRTIVKRYTTADVAATVEQFRETGVDNLTRFSMGIWFDEWAKSTGPRSVLTSDICSSLIQACHSWLDEWGSMPDSDTMFRFESFLTLIAIPILTRQRANMSQIVRLIARWTQSLQQIDLSEWNTDSRVVLMSFAHHLRGSLTTGKRLLINSLNDYLQHLPDDLWCVKIFTAMSLMAIGFTGDRMENLLVDSIKIAKANTDEGSRLTEVASVMENYLKMTSFSRSEAPFRR